MAAANPFAFTPADSARAVGEVYGVSLLVTVPLVVALLALVALRHAGAATRVLIWRGAIVALLVTCLGRALPWQWMAWVVPEGLAMPLIAFGRAQLDVLEGVGGTPRATAGGGDGVQAILLAYWLGVVLVLLPTMIARFRLHRVLARAMPLDERRWQQLLLEAMRTMGVRRPLRLVQAREVRVPMTWGTVRPVIVLPPAAGTWSDAQRLATLQHELAHVRSADALFALGARVMCALLWFHPGAWWVARRFASESELACDERVLLSGVSRSSYAELLVAACDARAAGMGGAVALAGGPGLRRRLAAIVDTRRALRVPSRNAVAVASLLTLVVSAPLGTVRIAPTRDVLTTLMRDARWESRAYAVVRLAQRPDSLEVARAAARHDPSPRVRALALSALAQRAALPDLTPATE